MLPDTVIPWTPLGTWAVAINQLYQANRLSPDVGATLARALELAGYRHVRADWTECRSDGLMVEMHPDPDNALSDGAQSLTPKQFLELMRQVKAVAVAVSGVV